MEYENPYEEKTDWSQYRPTFREDESGRKVCVMVPKNVVNIDPEYKPYYLES